MKHLFHRRDLNATEKARDVFTVWLGWITALPLFWMCAQNIDSNVAIGGLNDDHLITVNPATIPQHCSQNTVLAYNECADNLV